MSKEHHDYITNKEKKTIKLFEELMIKGKIFTPYECLDELTESFSDFDKSVAIKSNPESSKDSKATPDKSTKNSKVPSNKIDEELSDEF